MFPKNNVSTSVGQSIGLESGDLTLDHFRAQQTTILLEAQAYLPPRQT